MVSPLRADVAIQKPHRRQRLMTLTDPWRDPAGDGYQMTHALMAFGSGQAWGAGIGQGMQKLFYLPEPHTDFIFAVIGEELGLVGVGAILLSYGLIIWRGYVIARRAPEPFGAMLATGLTTALGLQICINMAVTLGLLPTKGLTLPFLSYGGTSLLMSMATVGVLMNIGATR
jgi:cell division protein FtsW